MHMLAYACIKQMKTILDKRPLSDSVRRFVADRYLAAARRNGARRFTVSVGEVHRALSLKNRVPAVCVALRSNKFLRENSVRLVSETGPPSGQSTTVQYTYEFVDSSGASAPDDQMEVWLSLRGALKDVYAAYGGGEAYLRGERENFYAPGQDPLNRDKP
jgi:nuclear transport factor 2 (NTF2) superfamily protein